MIINFDSLPVGTTVFEQFPGLRFPGTPNIVQPSMGAGSGVQALSNAQPGEEFNTQPLVVEFSAPQSFVRLLAGLDRSSSDPIQATLRAFDTDGNVVAQDGPIPVGPGPTVIRTLMRVEVATPSIVRAELEYSGAFAEVIDDLEFEVVGPEELPDTEAPTVTIIQPVDGADLTGEMFILEAEIQEERRLRSVSILIENDDSTQSFELSFSGIGPIHRVGPTFTGFLAEGLNTVVLSAEDFGGNVGTATVTVRRVAIAARLRLPQDGIELPRIPRFAPVVVELEETFPGSLAGRGNIAIRVVGPEDVRGFGVIRDFLNQPVPRLELDLFAGPRSQLGAASVTVQAIEQATGRILNTAGFPVSITPGRSVACPPTPPRILFYAEVDVADLARQINLGIDAFLADLDLPLGADLEKLNDMTVRLGMSDLIPALKVSQRYRVILPGPDLELRLVASLRPTVQVDEIVFSYTFYSSHVNPGGIPGTDFIKDRFDNDFRDTFRDELGETMTAAIDAARPGARAFLGDVYINPGPVQEFGIGFCLPATFFPNSDFIPDPLHSDNFSEDSLEGFEVVDDARADISAPSDWSYNTADQRIEQTSNIHGPPDHLNTSPDKPGTYLVGRESWPEIRDMVLVCHLNSGDNDGIGVVFRYQNPDNFYLFLMDAQRNYRRLGKKVGGVFQELEVPAVDTTEGYNLNQDYELTIIAGRSSPYIGEVFKVYVDGVEILSGRDRSLIQPGRVGFYAWGNTSARFLDLTVHPGGLSFPPTTF